jgi:hypothetical protein
MPKYNLEAIKSFFRFNIERIRGKIFPNAIKMPIKDRPFIGFVSNSLPYVILKELYDLDKRKTIDLDALIGLAEEKNHGNDMPLTSTTIGRFFGDVSSSYNHKQEFYSEFLEVRYIKTLSPLFVNHSSIDVMEINDRMFFHPSKMLWVIIKKKVKTLNFIKFFLEKTSVI